MELIRAERYEDALDIVRQRRTHPAGAELAYKIVESPYGGFSVVAIEPDLLADMLTGEIPAIPELRAVARRKSALVS